jgi:Tol biopolymer transport system component
MTVDGRTDVWAFGCVLYEMLTGRGAFRGDMVSDILASVLARDPDFTQLHAQLHPRLHETIQRCLEKDPKRRWQAIGDVRMEIERILATGGVMAPAAGMTLTPNAKLRLLLPWLATAILVAVAATWLLKPAPPPDPRPLARFDYELPEEQAFRNTGRQVVAFSPDGRHFVYNTTRGLFLRSMDSLAARLIPGTEDNMSNPFFSPDGEWVAYYSIGGAELRKITIAGGAPVTIGPAANGPFGAAWGTDGTILFAQPAGIMRVSADGGTPELVMKTKEGELAHGPSMLPDGRTILYTLTRAQGPTRWDQAEIVAQSIGSAEPKVVLRGGSDARYITTGHLVYAVGDVLFAVPFDVDKLAVKSGPVPMIQGVQRATTPGGNTAAANYGFTNRGALVYVNAVAQAAASHSTLGIVDRNGVVRRLDLPPNNYRSPRVSPDGRRVAVETIAENGQSIIWVYDLSGNTAIRRLTQEGYNTRPIWTRDSKSIAYGSDREKAHGIYLQRADGSGLPERLTTAEVGIQHFPESWSPNGQVLAFAATLEGVTNWALWTLAVDTTDKKPALFYDSPNSNEFGSAFSPDGKWIAYASNEGPDAQFGVYVQPYPPTGVKYEISRNGGAWPVWSPSGGELFYRLNVAGGSNNVAKIKAVTITTKPVPAFTSDRDLPIQGFLPVALYREYDILPNGREFVMVFPVAQTAAAAPRRLRIHIVLNWFEELKARVRIP